MKPLCIDLFCGLGGWAEGFLAEGYRVVGFDIDPRFAVVYPGEFVLQDVRTLDGRRFRDARCIVASPPCQGWSVAGIPRHWKGGFPDATTWDGAASVIATQRIVKAAAVPWLMENPRGMLRKFLPPRETTFLCAWGATWMKPTDLWGTYPGSFARPCGPHESARRGAKTGIQGIRDPALRAKIPLPLARAVARGFL